MTEQQPGAARLRRAWLGTLVVAIVAISLSACGGSSKPSYCSSVSNLKKSIKELPNVNVLQNGVSSLTSALTTIETNAKSVASSAKSDFPSQSSAVTNSVNALANSVKSISGNPTPASIVTIGRQVAAVVSSVESFASATSSKCS
jgi:cell division protein FtsX